MPNIMEGRLLGEGRKFALIVSRFNDFISDMESTQDVKTIVTELKEKKRKEY